MKRTYQPNKRRRQVRHGFMKRQALAKLAGSGSHVPRNRRRKGRKRLSV